MNEDRIRRLIEIFRESGVEEMEYQESFWRGIKLRLGRQCRQTAVRPPPPDQITPPMAAAPPAATPAAIPATEAPADDDGLHAVLAPMVGTFFRSSSPETESFVQRGDKVRAGQTLCIIEAMKIMNEIEADIDGEIVSIDAESGGPVEYNQPLFRIQPS